MLRGKYPARDERAGMNAKHCRIAAHGRAAGASVVGSPFVIQLIMRGGRGERARRQAELIGTLPPVQEMVGSPIVEPNSRPCMSGARFCAQLERPAFAAAIGLRKARRVTRLPEGKIWCGAAATARSDSAERSTPSALRAAWSRQQSGQAGLGSRLGAGRRDGECDLSRGNIGHRWRLPSAGNRARTGFSR